MDHGPAHGLSFAPWGTARLPVVEFSIARARGADAGRTMEPPNRRLNRAGAGGGPTQVLFEEGGHVPEY